MRTILFILVQVLVGIGAIAQTLPEQSHQSDIKLNPNLGDTPVLGFLDADNVRPSFRTTTDAEEWEDMGMATYRDDLATSIWASSPVTYQVTMQKSTTTEGLYRLVSPYGGNSYPYAMSGGYGKGYNCDKDYYMTIHAEDPSKVWIELEEQMDGDFGKCIFGSLVSYYLSQGQSLDELKEEHPEYFGTLVNGLITMPQRAMVSSLTEYANGGFFYANTSGLLAVALPDTELLDDYFVVRYNRINENVSNTDVYCDVFLGDDTGIDSVCVAFISETDAADAVKLNAVIENLKNGTHNNVIREKYGYIYYLNADGLPGEKHHVIAVEAGGDGTRFALSDPFMLPGWTPVYEGKYLLHILLGISEEYKYFIGPFIIYQISIDKTKFIIREWCCAFFSGFDMEYAQPFTFTMDTDGNCKVDAFNIGCLTSYGEYIKCSETETYYKNIGQGYNGATSRYDAEAGEFHFELSYYISQGTFGVGTEHFVIDKNFTAIENVIIPTEDADAPMFDLMGRRVFEGYKGIVVKNGKKYILR